MILLFVPYLFIAGACFIRYSDSDVILKLDIENIKHCNTLTEFILFCGPSIITGYMSHIAKSLFWPFILWFWLVYLAGKMVWG